MTRTALYKHYNEAADLLYVGISVRPGERLSEHLAGSHWADEIAHVSLEWFATREDAEKAERIAIRDESPWHNIAHNSPCPIRAFVNAVGTSELSARLGVGKTAISNAVVRGRFPCSWAYTTALLCAEHGVFFPANGFPWAGEMPAEGVALVDAILPAGAAHD